MRSSGSTPGSKVSSPTMHVASAVPDRPSRVQRRSRPRARCEVPHHPRHLHPRRHRQLRRLRPRRRERSGRLSHRQTSRDRPPRPRARSPRARTGAVRPRRRPRRRRGQQPGTTRSHPPLRHRQQTSSMTRMRSATMTRTSRSRARSVELWSSGCLVALSSRKRTTDLRLARRAASFSSSRVVLAQSGCNIAAGCTIAAARQERRDSAAILSGSGRRRRRRRAPVRSVPGSPT